MCFGLSLGVSEFWVPRNIAFGKLLNVSKDMFLFLQDGLNNSTFLKIKGESPKKCFESNWHIISTQ